MTNKYLYHVFFVLCVNQIVFGDSKIKSSLTFVIDDTYSMHDDIEQVKRGANRIFDTVMAHSNSSQIGNFVLVTFNDPDTKLRIITKDRDDFKKALSSIIVHGGGNCPEYAMTGIRQALEESLPQSYLYIFTDASAHDYNMFEAVKSLAITKQAQIVFVLTGMCGSEDSKDYQVYHGLAKATKGQVFHLERQEVGYILNFVVEQVKGPRTELFSKDFPAGYGHKFNITIDHDTAKSPTISATGDKPSIDVTGPNGTKPEKEILLDTKHAKIVKLNNAKPGPHTVEVGSESKTSVLITARTEINFLLGFSTFRPSSIKDTTTRPAPGVKSHLSIILTEGDIKLQTAKIIDMHDTTLQEIPLELLHVKEKYYVTMPINTPDTMFRIAITGYDPKNNSTITRTASTPIEPQKIIAEETKARAPLVFVEGEPKIIAEYDEPLDLKCLVNAYPKPNIIWKNKNTGAILPGEESVKELPYDYISILHVNKVNKNTTYQCEANDQSKDVMVETIRKTYFKIAEKPKRKTAVEFNKEGKLVCNVDSYPSTKITWYKNGRAITADNIAFSSNKSVLSINNMRLANQGRYICEIRYESKRLLFSSDVYVVGIEVPTIDTLIKHMRVMKGDVAEIHCKVLKGKPRPSISWTFEGKQSNEVVEKTWINQETIILRNVNKTHTGTYFCKAINEIGKDDHSIHLVVEYPPTIKPIRPIKATVGDEIAIRCIVDGVPTPTVTWYKDEEVISNKTLLFTSGSTHAVRIEASLEDRGTYNCVAANEHGVETREVKVEIFQPPTIKTPDDTKLYVKVGSSETLPCEAKGYPKPEIGWLFHRFNSSSPFETIRTKGESFVHLKRVQIEQEGTYTCVARNAAGETRITYEIFVGAPPIIENEYPEKLFRTVKGDFALRINCKASGNPKPEIIWLKDELNIAYGDGYYKQGGLLIIANVQKDSEGVYICEAKNRWGSAREVYEVSVDDFPSTRYPGTSFIIERGQSAYISCNIPHEKTDQLRWFKNGRLIHTGELTLSAVKPSDSGLYACRVSNFFKSASGHVEVKVGSKPEFTSFEDEDIEFERGRPVVLVCDADGVPEPKVAWYHNGKKLNETETFYILTMTTGSQGQYTCEISNDFGSIKRTFNVASRDCLFDITKVSKHQPLMVSGSLAWPSFDISGGFMSIAKDEYFNLFCPTRFNKFPSRHITAFCDKATSVQVNGVSYEYSELQCTEEVQHIVEKTGKQCYKEDSEMLKIAYKLDWSEKIVVYEICFDKTNNVSIYAKHMMSNTPADVELDSDWLDRDEISQNVEELYDCRHQQQTISRLLRKPFHEDDGCCFAKKLLVNSKDVFPGVPQRAVNSYLNIVPHWSTCNTENWDDIERRVRSLAKYTHDGIMVWTGTANMMYLLDARNKWQNIYLMDKRSNRRKIPIYLWKVVRDPESSSSLAIIQVNVPDLLPSKAYMYTLCRDICDSIKWMKNPNWRNVNKGYTYCCTIQDFKRAFSFNEVFKKFDRDEILAEESSFPEHSLTLT